MASIVFCSCLVLLLPSAPDASAADRIILRDGRVILGQVLDPTTRGETRFVVRRAWAEENLPDRLPFWEDEESRRLELARRQRRDRLEHWRHDRQAHRAVGEADPILEWVENELRKLDPGGETTVRPPLLLVTLKSQLIHTIDRPSDDARRMLRQAWRAGFDTPESLPLDDLCRMLEGRGFALSAIDPAPIEDLVGLAPESDNAWRIRRAATEIAREPGLRYIHYLGLVLPENPRQAGPNELARVAQGVLGELLGAPSTRVPDPLKTSRRQVERAGRTGMVVTELEIAPDLSSVSVVATLWVRVAPDRWVPASRRPARVRTVDADPNGMAGIAADPRVQEIFQTIDALGLSGPGQQHRQLSLQVGAATRQALGRATAALQRDIESVDLPVGR